MSVSKPTKEELEKWEKILESEGLGMDVGLDSRLVYVGSGARLAAIEQENYALTFGCGGGRRVQKKRAAL